MKKILILGSTGLIGHQIFNCLNDANDYEILNLSKTRLNSNTIVQDVTNEKEFSDLVKNFRPNFIINCIGILIDEAKKNPEKAIYLNALFPHILLRLSNLINAKLIHMSTDCVFSGKKFSPYIESDFKDGEDLYSKTKGIGEIIENNHLTIRTSVVGPELKLDGSELFHWFMTQVEPINGYRKSIWSGVTTIVLARAVKFAIENDINGLYHLTNNLSIDKFQLLNIFKKFSKKKININEVDGRVVDKSFIDTRGEIKIVIPNYEEMIREMIDYINKNADKYKFYH